MVQRLPVRLRLLVGIAVLVAMVLVGTTAGPETGDAEPAEAPKPADPAPAVWTEADKDGFGTSTTNSSKVWYTIDDGKLTEVYYPDLGTPSVRDLQFIVSDGKTFAELETEATNHQVQLIDRRALVYRQINTKPGTYRITKTYVTDPARSTVLVDVKFESLTGKPYQLYAIYDPSLDNGGTDDSATSEGARLLASDVDAASEGGDVASALVGAPGFIQGSSGHLGVSDGWTDLKEDFKMDWDYRSASNGNVVQTAKTALSGLPNSQRLTLSLGFGTDKAAALEGTQASLKSGFQTVQNAYQTGWDGYLDSLKPAPAGVGQSGGLLHTTYDVSLMTLAAHEDKTYRGAYIASPSTPWVWGTGLDSRGADDTSGAYHLVWSRDLYQIATALLAAGDEGGAERALTYLFERQQKPDGSFPQNSYVDGRQRWENVQLDEVAFPIVLAWQLGQTDQSIFTKYKGNIQKAADYIVANGPATPQERWENQGGWSPATIAAEIAGLVCAADIAKANGDQASANTYLSTADNWQQNVEKWTVTTNGPLSDDDYYLRITKSPGANPADSDVPPDPNAPTTYSIGDSGPSAIDQRLVVDTSYLELVRLGVKRADNPIIVNTLDVVDSDAVVGPFSTPPNEPQKRGLRVDTPNGTFWHRFNFDGYGEQRDGAPWDIGFPTCDAIPEPPEPPVPCLEDQKTLGRAWPIFAGERGEYELAAGGSAAAGSAAERLSSIARTGNAGYMLPEQVWDENPPSGQPGFPTGEGTFSATPLAWTHAQFVRLAWSIQDGKPVERPSIVYDRYRGATSQAGG